MTECVRAELTPRAQHRMEQRWECQREAVELLGIIVAEWNSDPTSVQCFDLRIIERAKLCVATLKALPEYP